MQVEQVAHESVRCDGCGVCPIKGMRYKCNTCVNFDFCSECNEAKTETMHVNGTRLFTQIRKPRPHDTKPNTRPLDRGYSVARMLSVSNGRKYYGADDDDKM